MNLSDWFAWEDTPTATAFDFLFIHYGRSKTTGHWWMWIWSLYITEHEGNIFWRWGDDE